MRLRLAVAAAWSWTSRRSGARPAAQRTRLLRGCQAGVSRLDTSAPAPLRRCRRAECARRRDPLRLQRADLGGFEDRPHRSLRRDSAASGPADAVSLLSVLAWLAAAGLSSIAWTTRPGSLSTRRFVLARLACGERASRSEMSS